MKKWIVVTALLLIPAGFHLRRDPPVEVSRTARPRLERLFADAGCGYPPREVSLVALKEERRLEVWANDRDPRWRRITEYPILPTVSGQVPEGLYRIVALNPDLSMKIDYPNATDLAHGSTGSDIFIHGGSASIGCIAVGDPAIEELHTLVADTGLVRASVTIAPRDFRTVPPAIVDGPSWVATLYDRIGEDLRRKSAPAPPAPPQPQR